MHWQLLYNTLPLLPTRYSQLPHRLLAPPRSILFFLVFWSLSSNGILRSFIRSSWSATLSSNIGHVYWGIIRSINHTLSVGIGFYRSAFMASVTTRHKYV